VYETSKNYEKNITTEGKRMNNTERELWLSNDEALYNFWKSTRLSKREFLKKHRTKIDNYIKYKIQ